MNGPFFQNPNNYPMLLAHPAHKGSVQLPAKKVVEGSYYKKYPFLVEVKNPKPEDVVFSQSDYEGKQLPVQKAEPLPNTTTAVSTVTENTDPGGDSQEDSDGEAEEVSGSSSDSEGGSEPSTEGEKAPEVKGTPKKTNKFAPKNKGKK